MPLFLLIVDPILNEAQAAAFELYFGSQSIGSSTYGGSLEAE